MKCYESLQVDTSADTFSSIMTTSVSKIEKYLETRVHERETSSKFTKRTIGDIGLLWVRNFQQLSSTAAFRSHPSTQYDRVVT